MKSLFYWDCRVRVNDSRGSSDLENWEHDNTGLLSRHYTNTPHLARYVAIHRRIRTSIWFRLQIEFGTITRSSRDKRPQNDWDICYKLSKKEIFYFIRHCQIWNVNDSLIVPSAPSLCLTCGGESSVAKEWPSEEHYLTRLPFPCIIIQHDSMTRLSHWQGSSQLSCCRYQTVNVEM